MNLGKTIFSNLFLFKWGTLYIVLKKKKNNNNNNNKNKNNNNNMPSREVVYITAATASF